jgi:hypothetical protein
VPTTARLTTAQLAEAIAIISARTEDLLSGLENMQANAQTESDRVWTTLGTIAGLDGVAVGVAEVAELLGPLRGLVPPSTALPLEPGVDVALAAIRSALGGRRDTNFGQVPKLWDFPIGPIGQADPSAEYPILPEEMVA